jgi:hypothetical protein
MAMYLRSTTAYNHARCEEVAVYLIDSFGNPTVHIIQHTRVVHHNTGRTTQRTRRRPGLFD